ncbi:C39 family peptidase [Actinocorallia sp. B10E7]|uniref:C39 family peptidase n=1 Tax=Actinocorallia sp. B10E7 TaxID=3153558 RepID=UPI00325F33C8
MNKVLASLVSGTALTATLVVLQPPAPAEAKGISLAGSPARLTLKINKTYQARPLWCAPAGASISLAKLGVNVGQKTLAKKMKTKSPYGTYDYDAVRVLNSYASKKGYRFSLVYDVNKPGRLAKRVVHDVGVLRRAVPLQVYMKRLPWYKGLIDGNPGHLIVAYGYDKKAKTVTIWDPYNYYFNGGTHVMPLNKLAKATQSTDGAAGMFYLTKD